MLTMNTILNHYNQNLEIGAKKIELAQNYTIDNKKIQQSLTNPYETWLKYRSFTIYSRP